MELEQKNGKYLKIYRDIKNQLLSGTFADGEKLPTEHEYSERFGVSRPTVTKALNALEGEGLITRKTGSGSYARRRPANSRNKLFGLLIPGLGRGEIFEPICTQIAYEAEKNGYSLLWSGFDKTDKLHPLTTPAITQRYIDNGVAGVFFQPLEHWHGHEDINRDVIRILEDARVPIVLVDADYLRFPERSRFDLISLDNYRAGYTAARHILDKGALRVDFLKRPYSADSVNLRVRGYVSALVDAGLTPEAGWIHVGYPEDDAFVRAMVKERGARYLICANDETASCLLVTLERAGIAVPNEVGIVGFDDVRYSRHLRVPLTTVGQPCEEIGRLAVETMFRRIANPDRPACSLFVPGTLIVRRSSGGTENDE